MSSAVDILEERVVAAAALIASLRIKVRTLERELTSTHDKAAAQAPFPGPPESALVSELERLRAERIVIRDGIRGLLRELDRISC